MKNRLVIYLIIILLSSLFTHFLFFGHPNETVFDEVHFGKFISGYFTHEYFFDIHPPLAKLLISGAGYLAGFKPGFSFNEIGLQFPDSTYLWMRLVPTMAGILLPIIIFLLALRLGISRAGSFAAGMFVVFDNAILVQSRFILLDSLLLLFGFSALLAYLKYSQQNKAGYLFLAGILGALALSVKWTGATFLALIIILELIVLIKNRKNDRLLKDLVALIAIPLVLYFSIFAIHFALLGKSGPGDAFMTPRFQKTLEGSNYQNDQGIKPLNIFSKFTELNIEMYKANASLTASHPYSSKWFTWPLMVRPIYYWHENTQTVVGKESRIYFMGNPLTWWVSTVAIIYALLSIVYVFADKIRKGQFHNAERKLKNKRFALLGGAFLLNLLPFIGITRAMFLYHYLPALIFAILALVCLIDELPNRNKIFAGLIIASGIVFVFFSPLTYGLPLSSSAYNLRVWLPSWR